MTSEHNEGLGSDDGQALPALGQNAIKGQLGEALVEAAMLQLDQLYERRTGLDFGIDGVIELTTGGVEKKATGRQIGVQVKRGLSVVKLTRYGFTHYCTESHANYWLRHSLPIIVVHSDPATGRLRWQQVRADTLRRTNHGYAIDLPLDSDLRISLTALHALADRRQTHTASAEQTLTIPYSIKHGVCIDDPELGLAALEFSRAALRNLSCRVMVEVQEEPDFVAEIDTIRDVRNPTAEDRRKAIMHEDILHRIRRQARMLQHALMLLLTKKEFAEYFGYRDDLVAEAIRYLVELYRAPYQSRKPGETALQAWPAHDMEHLTITFDVPNSVIEEFYAQNEGNRIYLRMGAAGGNFVSDLNSNIVATRLLPVMAQRFVAINEDGEVLDANTSAAFNIPPSIWMMGLA